MRELTYSKKGLIWRLASVYGPIHQCDTETNICEYWQAVLKGFGVVLCFMFAGALLGAMLGDFTGWVAAMLVQGMYIYPGELAVIVASVIGLVAFLVTIGGLVFVKRKSGLHAPSFATEAYTSWKEKTCVKVNLT